MAAFAASASAFPTKTSACVGCHSGVNVPVTATAGSVSGTTVMYTLDAPSATAIAVFDGANKVATLGANGSFSATVGKTYIAYSVTGPTTGDGVGSVTFTATAPVVIPAAPAAPVLSPTYNTSNGNVTITWAAVTGATSYDYQVAGGAVLSTTGTSVSLSALAEGNTAFALRATNAGGSSAYTPTTIVYTVPVVIPAAPSAPVLNAVYNTSTGNVTVAWAVVAGATSYDYQVGSGMVISTTGTSVSLTGLPVGNTALQVRATNSGGPSAYTATTIVYTAPIPDPTPTPAPTGYSVRVRVEIDHGHSRNLTAVLTDMVTGAQFTAKLGHEGGATFVDVPAGTYTLSVVGGDHIEFHSRTVVVGAPALEHEHYDD
jgi:hypothetical protein